MLTPGRLYTSKEISSILAETKNPIWFKVEKQCMDAARENFDETRSQEFLDEVVKDSMKNWSLFTAQYKYLVLDVNGETYVDVLSCIPITWEQPTTEASRQFTGAFAFLINGALQDTELWVIIDDMEVIATIGDAEDDDDEFFLVSQADEILSLLAK